MPIVHQKEVNSKVRLAVWKIEETVEELLPLLFFTDQKDITDNLLEKKKLEIIATRHLLKHLVENEGITYSGISKDSHGKPHLLNTSGIHISISHAYPYAAAILDLSGSTGIDIEAPREQILRIRHKFLSEVELNLSNDIDHLTILWAAKECLYKIYGRKQLIFKQHLAIAFRDSDTLKGEINIDESNEVFGLKFEKVDTHWLVYKEGTAVS